MGKYERYQQINEKWFSQVPTHWETGRVKAIFNTRKERNNPVKTDFILSLTAKQGVVPYTEKEDVGGNKHKNDLTQYNIAHENDLLVNCMNIVSGAAGVSKYFGAISPVYYALYPRQNDNIWYFNYLFRLSSFQRSLIGLGKGILMHESDNGKLNTVRMRISMDSLGNVLLPIPPRQEQDQIVYYLDWQTSKINRLIAAKKQQIQVLREYALSVCNELLTRGVNPNVTFQPTGSSWMGKIPAHWKTSKIAKHFTIKKRIAGKEGYDVLSITQQGLKVKDVSANEGQMAANYSGYQFVYPGDFAMNHMDLLTGYIDISKHFGVTSPDYRVFVLDDTENCYPEYYLQLFQLCYKRKIFYGYGRGAANQGRWRMPAVNFRSFEIPLPPHEEQVVISAKIREINAQIESACSKLESEISTLSEMKTRLISDVVTGQIDVRNIEVPDFELVEEAADEAEEPEDEMEVE